MKKNKKKNLVKGTPTAVLVSIGIHLLVLVVAGGFVVFKIIDREEAQFVPPAKVDRPKMELKKPRVKVKKTSKPRSTTRIVSKSVAS
ncbi:MAG TPA: hypothetical protein VJ904_03855, partial [Tichowtungia sp.]|nr:hypothetical protein [Tichowtungia sp.]